MGSSRLGDYELGDLVGHGGVGQVHAARDLGGRSVVVKRLRDSLSRDTRMRQRLGDEGRVCRRVSHPNVIRMFENGNAADGSPFIVMDHAPGITLRRLVDDSGPLPIARIRGLVMQLFDGLTAIHAAGIVHADLNSSNIIVDTVDGADHLTIIDFGLARTKTSESRFDDGLVTGTPEFMAPELFGGANPMIASDVYAVGIIIYEMLVGTTPFSGASPMQILQRQMTEPVAFPPETCVHLSVELERVLLCALDRNATYRFLDVSRFANAFDEATRTLATKPHATGSRIPPITICDMEPMVSTPIEDPVIQHWHNELLVALESPPTDPIIVAYLGLANALIKSRRMVEAIQELEDALAVLSPRTGTPLGPVWRIALLLAALYDRFGDRARGRQHAMDAHDHAIRVGDRDGVERTRKLLRRLGASRGTIKPATERTAETVHTRQTIRFSK